MRKMVFLAAASALLSTLLVAGSAVAAPPEGGCPTGAWWTLIEPIHNPNPADLNGDEWLCRLILPSGGFTGHDNVVRARWTQPPRSPVPGGRGDFW